MFSSYSNYLDLRGRKRDNDAVNNSNNTIAKNNDDRDRKRMKNSEEIDNKGGNKNTSSSSSSTNNNPKKHKLTKDEEEEIDNIIVHVNNSDFSPSAFSKEDDRNVIAFTKKKNSTSNVNDENSMEFESTKKTIRGVTASYSSDNVSRSWTSDEDESSEEEVRRSKMDEEKDVKRTNKDSHKDKKTTTTTGKGFEDFDIYDDDQVLYSDDDDNGDDMNEYDNMLTR